MGDLTASTGQKPAQRSLADGSTGVHTRRRGTVRLDLRQFQSTLMATRVATPSFWAQERQVTSHQLRQEGEPAQRSLRRRQHRRVHLQRRRHGFG
jgi:hypothetical protein